MGIPSYFSYIIKNYSNIIRNKSSCEKIQHLLMDCNSIIYDSYRELEEKYKKEPFDLTTIETQLIHNTIDKIVEYIMTISPDKSAFITFDGVAPFAKMDQQKIRRFKTQTSISSNSPPIWNTTSITPGTTFMTNLSKSVKSYFQKHQIPNIRVFTSCSDEIGEGEHKLFHMLRTTDCNNSVKIFMFFVKLPHSKLLFLASLTKKNFFLWILIYSLILFSKKWENMTQQINKCVLLIMFLCVSY